MTIINPVSPGEMLQEEFLKPLGLTSYRITTLWREVVGNLQQLHHIKRLWPNSLIENQSEIDSLPHSI